MTESQDDARLRAVYFECRVDIVLRLLEHDPLRIVNRLGFQMSALAIVDREGDRTVMRLQPAKGAVVMACLNAFVEELIEAIDTHQPALMLSVERVEKFGPLLSSNFASLHAGCAPGLRCRVNQSAAR